MKPDTILFILSEIAKEMQKADLDRQLYLLERRNINLKKLNDMAKKKNTKDIQIGDKLLFSETGFEYVVLWTTEKSVKVINKGENLWLPKTLIEIWDSLLSTSGYKLFKLKAFPEWFAVKNNIN